MRLLLDQNLSRDLPALLAGPTFDVADTRTLGMRRWDDDAITDYAAAEGRVIVSADTDFGAILAARQSAKPSFVLLRRTNNLSPEAIAAVPCCQPASARG
jgi:predicted nuclease of predicted toxin-antitoxin system